jgi:tRNA-specific 2-thiouridylase
MQKELEKYVIRNFCQEYLRGRTPNPCIRCNQYIKFDALLRKATALGAKFLATGHYARIEKIQNPQPKGFREAQSKIQKYLIRKAKDLKKDQSYFLYRLNQNQLKYILFPLGDYTKDQVRKLAREFDLPVADKLASQEICFLPDMDYRRFLKARLSYKLKPGLIVDIEGNILGKHQGITFYTIGQREGLGIAKGYPLYITKIDAQRNQITVGKKEDALKKEFLVKDLHFVLRPIKKKIEFKVRIRYNHKEKLAELIPWHNRIKVCFKQTQFAITPGQAAVFYDQDKVIGGGIIDKIIS